MTDSYALLAANVRRLRKEGGVSKIELARRMGYKTNRMVCHLEAGDNRSRAITLDLIDAAATALGVKSSELLK